MYEVPSWFSVEMTTDGIVHCPKITFSCGLNQEMQLDKGEYSGFR